MEAFGGCAAEPFARPEAAVLVVRCAVRALAVPTARLRCVAGVADGVAGAADCGDDASDSECARRAKVARRLRKAASVCLVRYPE